MGIVLLNGQPRLIREEITAISNNMGASALHLTALSSSLDELKYVLKMKKRDFKTLLIS
jgi:hypothetical protein